MALSKNIEEQRSNEMVHLYEVDLLTMQEIGDRYGLSRQRVHQIIQAAEGKRGLSRSHLTNRGKRMKNKVSDWLDENPDASLTEASAALGVSYNTVLRYADKNRIKRYTAYGTRKSSQERRAQVISLISSGMSHGQVAEEIGITRQRVQQIVSRGR